MTVHSIKSIALYGARELIADLHGDPWRVAHQAGLPAEALEQLELLLPAEKALRFLTLAAAATGREDFGLLLAQRQSMGVLGVLLDVVSGAATVGEWLERMSRYFYLVSTAALVHLEPHALGMTLHYEVIIGDGADDQQLVQLGLALLVRKLRSVIDPHWMPERVMFRCREPQSMASFTKMFGQGLLFNQERNGLLLSHSVLAWPLHEEPRPSALALTEFMRENHRRRRKSMALATDDSVRKLLAHNGAPLSAVARDQLHSERTLQRKLAQAGTSFKAIKGQAKLELACKCLGQSDMKLTQIAELLGFSSLSAFSRFFRAAQGCTAKDYRSAQRAREH